MLSSFFSITYGQNLLASPVTLRVASGAEFLCRPCFIGFL
jgi:hypothetical protein